MVRASFVHAGDDDARETLTRSSTRSHSHLAACRPSCCSYAAHGKSPKRARRSVSPRPRRCSSPLFALWPHRNPHNRKSPILCLMLQSANYPSQSHILIAVSQTSNTPLHTDLDIVAEHDPRAPNSASRFHHTHPSAGQRPQERYIRPLAPREKAKKWFPCSHPLKEWSQPDQEKTFEEEKHSQPLI